MNVRRAAILLFLTALSVGGSLALGGHGSAEAAKTPATCSYLLNESFANNSAGWELGPEWEIGPASQSSGHEIGYPDPAMDHTSDSDNGVAGVVIGGNTTTDPHPYWYITSPTIHASGSVDFVGVDFWRWLNSDVAPDMVNSVEVYDGANWITLWTGGGITEDQWTEQSYDLTAYNNAQMRFRIGHSVGSAGAHVVSSWNIDDVAVTECHQLPPPPPPPPPPPQPPPPPPPPPPGCTGPISILVAAADPYPSTCSISGLSGTITDVNLVLYGLSHSWPDDIDMLLVSPQGQNALVMSDAGGGGSLNVIDLTLDDQAAIVLPDTLRISTGSYQPADYEPGDTFPAPAPAPTGAVSLGTFNGTNPNGTWSLYVVDDTFGDIGSINGWDLQITTAGGPPPPPPPLPPPPPPPPPPPAPPRCRVPKVIGLRLATARRRISARKCRVGTVRRTRSRRVGRVISQRPRGGVTRPRGYRVRLVVGRR